MQLATTKPKPAASTPSQPELPLAAFAPSSPPPPPKVVINQPLDFELKGLRPDHPYLTSREFSPSTIRHFGLGYCARGLMAGRIVIPLHDNDNRLVGYAGRIVDDALMGESEPKYRFPSGRERNGVTHEFRKSHLVYNLNRLKVTAERLIVVEGFASVWWLNQAGFHNSVALMGWSCSEEQASLLLAKSTPSAQIYILPDGDEAGERCAHSVFQALGSHRWIRWIRLEASRQPTDCSPEDFKSLFSA